MRLEENPALPPNPETAYEKSLNFVLVRLLKNIAAKVNAIGDGRLVGSDLVATAVPTTGTYATGDFVKNSSPSELGTAGSKYYIDGWKCLAGGTPGTFVQKRCLTGN